MFPNPAAKAATERARILHRPGQEPGQRTLTGRRAGGAPQPGWQQTLALAQSGFYLVTGIWPFVSARTFQQVTGPKTDFWLVKTVGALVSVVGGVIGLAALRRRITPEVALLAVGSAASLAAIDVVYTLRRRISPVYLADAAAEAVLIAGWLMAGREQGGEETGWR